MTRQMKERESDNILEVWACSRCKKERGWADGVKTEKDDHGLPSIYAVGAWLRCLDGCRQETVHHYQNRVCHTPWKIYLKSS